MSDGIKAYTGVIMTLIAESAKIILIDEPEAFLHPSLATSLGKEIGNNASKDSKVVFASTHSSAFLMGCIQSGVPLNVLRLTYSSNIATATLLPQERILKLMRNPLLRSMGILDGLFYDYVIVTEGDADRAFYNEINNRLLSCGRGIKNCLFVNAQNKQTIHSILTPMREMGIPSVGIVDIDIVKEGGTVWFNLLQSLGFAELSINPTSSLRGGIKQALEKHINYKRSGGISVLTDKDQRAAADLFDLLQKHGLFVVRNGELESWLKTSDQTISKSRWLVEIFERMGEDPSSASYIRPTDNDVWIFMDQIKTWFEDFNRKQAF